MLQSFCRFCSVWLLHSECLQAFWSKLRGLERRCLFDLGRINGFNLYLIEIPLVRSSWPIVIQAGVRSAPSDSSTCITDNVCGNPVEADLHHMDLYRAFLWRWPLYNSAKYTEANLRRPSYQLVRYHANLHWPLISSDDRLAWDYTERRLPCILLDHSGMLTCRPLHLTVHLLRD